MSLSSIFLSSTSVNLNILKERIREATYQKYNELPRSSNEIKKVSIGKNKAVPFLSNDNKNRHLTQA